EEERGSVWIPDALLEGGEALAAANHCGSASDRFRRFIREFPRHPDLPRVKLALGRCLLSEAEGEAILVLRRLWVAHPDTPEAEEADRLLKEAPVRAEPWTGEEYAARAAQLYQRGRWKTALTAWQLARDRQWRPEPNDWHQMAQARFHLKQHDQAIPLYRKAGGASGLLGELKAQYRLGRYQQALAVGHRLWARDPERPEAQEGRYLTAFVLKDQGRPADAIRTWIDLVDRAPEGNFATQALWHAGWTAYQQGGHTQARAVFRRLAREYPHSTLADQAAYWEARAQERLGDGEAARPIYRRLTRLPRWSYYTYRAADRLRALYGETVPSPAPPPTPTPIDIGAGPPREEGRPDVTSGDLHERRGRELALLGFASEARREARRAAETRDLDLWGMIRVGSLLSEWGEQGEALRLAAQWQGRMEAERVDRYWQLLYPRAYFLRPARGPDPLLVEAVIREESRFDPLAVSRAGAIGLMQILPETGAVLARRIGREIPSTRTLFDVDQNLELGVAYLDQLLAEFDQNILLAVASYNAGSRAVRGWAARNGRLDRDEFVEAIPYRETRLYVKRVLHSYWEYRRIYRDRGP
ncbi:MAG: transglycosylase SLT domain-containing protein, partial [Nitrospirae bacterium]|nr:transglycosylase SLT domain-containing protein [Nitrospirota bacterium]